MTTTVPGAIVSADPYPWPWTGQIDLEHTALVLIDWQHDFCGPGGYVDAMGYELSLTRGPVDRHASRSRRLAPLRRARSSIRGKVTSRICPTARPTSSGDLDGSGPESATPARAAASSCAASQAGRSSPS